MKNNSRTLVFSFLLLAMFAAHEVHGLSSRVEVGVTSLQVSKARAFMESSRWSLSSRRSSSSSRISINNNISNNNRALIRLVQSAKLALSGLTTDQIKTLSNGDVKIFGTNNNGDSNDNIDVDDIVRSRDGRLRVAGTNRALTTAETIKYLTARRDAFVSAGLSPLEATENEFDIVLFGKGYLVGLLTQILPFLNDVETWEDAKASLNRCLIAPLKDAADTFREAIEIAKGIALPSTTDLKDAAERFKTEFNKLREGVKDFDIPSIASAAVKIIADSKIGDFIDDLKAGFSALLPAVLGLALNLHQCGYSTYALAIFVAVLLMLNPVGWILLAIKVIMAIAVVVDIVLNAKKAYDAFKEAAWFVFGVALGVITGDLFDLIALANADKFKRQEETRDYKYRTEKGKLVTELENPPSELQGNAKQYGRTIKQSYSAEVVKVYDGDTITVRRPGGKTQKIRFAGIDAPEMAQPGGKEARDALQALIDSNGGKVKVMSYGTDLYGRSTADIFVGKKWAQSDLLAGGHAYHYRAYDSRKHLDDLMSAAQKNKVGIWANKGNVAPWDYRKGKKVMAHIPTETKNMKSLFPWWISDLLAADKLFNARIMFTALVDWAKDIFAKTPIDIKDVEIPVPNACKLDPRCSKLIELAGDFNVTTAFAAANSSKVFEFVRTKAQGRFKLELRTSFGTAQGIITDSASDKPWVIESEGETDIADVPLEDGELPPDTSDKRFLAPPQKSHWQRKTNRRRKRKSNQSEEESQQEQETLLSITESESSESSSSSDNSAAYIDPNESSSDGKEEDEESAKVKYTVVVEGLQATSFDLVISEPSDAEWDAAKAAERGGNGSQKGGGGLSAGATAAVVIVVIAAIGAAIGGAFWFKKRSEGAGGKAAEEAGKAGLRKAAAV